MKPQKTIKYLVVKYDTGITDFLDEKFLDLIKQFLKKGESLVKIFLIDKKVINCELIQGNDDHLERIKEKFKIKSKKKEIKNPEDHSCAECDKHFKTGTAIRYEYEKTENEKGFCWFNNPEYKHEICPECLSKNNTITKDLIIE